MNADCFHGRDMVRGGWCCILCTRFSHHDVHCDWQEIAGQLDPFHFLESILVVYLGVFVIAAFEVANASLGIGLLKHTSLTLQAAAITIR